MKNNNPFAKDFPDFEDFKASFNSNNFNFGNVNTSSEDNNSSSIPFGNIDMNTIFKIKQIMEKMNASKNDPRSNLLNSLKPYLRESRKNKLNQYIRAF